MSKGFKRIQYADIQRLFRKTLTLNPEFCCRHITLTAGLNTVAGGAGGDTIDGGSTTDTWTAFDNIDGGAGTDTMTVLSTSASAPGGITLKNVESLTINTSGAGYTIDASGFTGLTSLSVNGSDNTAGDDMIVTAATTTVLNIVASAYDDDFTVTGGLNSTVSGTKADDMLIEGAAGTLTVTAGAEAADILSVDAQGLTTVTVLDGGIVAIGDGLDTLADVTFDDDATTDTLTTVSITGNLGVSTINSDKLTSLTLGNSAQDSTVTAAAGTRALALSVNKLTGGTIADATATTLNLSTTGTATTGVTINAAAATTATIAADVALTATLGLDVATSLAISGDSVVTATLSDTDSLASVTVTGSAGLSADLSTQTALTAITASGTSGNNTVSIDATTATYAGGSGVDSVTVLATVTKAVNGGDGTADVFTWNVDGSYTTDTDVTGFEVIGAGALVDADTISATGYTKLTQGAITGAVTWSNVAANSTLTITEDPGFATVVTLADANGLSDVFNLTLTKSGAAGVLAAGSVTVAGVETIAITTDDSDTTLVSPTDTLTLVAAAATTITVAGDAGLNLTYAGTTATTIDASGITAGAFTYNSDALAAAATIKGSAAGTNTVDLTDTLGIVTYTGGTGNDVIANTNNLNNVYTLGNGANSINTGGAAGNGNNTVTAGSGVDTIKLGNGNNTIDAGAGNNVIIVGTGANTITTGAGNDTITVGASAGLNTVNVGTGTDSVVIGGVQTAAGYYTSITGMAAGDTIDLSALTTVARGDGALGAKITLGGASSFANYLDAATATQIADAGASLVKWFQFSGNTYIVVDTTKAADTPDDNVTFQDGIDSVIELVGLVDLSTSTTATDVLTLV